MKKRKQLTRAMLTFVMVMVIVIITVMLLVLVLMLVVMRANTWARSGAGRSAEGRRRVGVSVGHFQQTAGGIHWKQVGKS